MIIGLLSDTHGWLDPTLKNHFQRCDEIWHAGDLGPEVANELQQWKPLRAVFGNIDDAATRHLFPEHYKITLGGISIWMTHIGGSPPAYHPSVRSSLNSRPPNVFICGHSHIAKVYQDPAKGNMLFLNPGAAGQHGFHHMRTAMRLQVKGGTIASLELIELGLRGKLP